LHRALIRNDLPRRDVDVKRHRLVASVRSYLDVVLPRREGQRLGRRDKLADSADVHPIHTDLAVVGVTWKLRPPYCPWAGA
jgi:hypothetical protein